jgi:hypothetical protein
VLGGSRETIRIDHPDENPHASNRIHTHPLTDGHIVARSTKIIVSYHEKSLCIIAGYLRIAQNI